MSQIIKLFEPFFLVSYVFTNECFVFDNVSNKMIMETTFLTRCKHLIHAIMVIFTLGYYFPLHENNTNTIVIQMIQLIIYILASALQIFGYLDYYTNGSTIMSIVHKMKKIEEKLARFNVAYASKFTKSLRTGLLLDMLAIYMLCIGFMCNTIYQQENPLILEKLHVLLSWTVKMCYSFVMNLVVREGFVHVNNLLQEIRDDVGNNCQLCNNIDFNHNIKDMCLKHALK